MADRPSSTSDSETAFAALLDQARTDPTVIGLWLGGSRGKGLVTALSDWDVGLVVGDDSLDDWRARLAGPPAAPFDAMVFTLAGFADHAAWGGPAAWDRYSFAGLKALADKTGAVQPLIDAKGRVPEGEIEPFVRAALDHFVNQVYRAAKCARDGDPLAARLEAAEAIGPLLDGLFALDGGRLRPYPKYLALELKRAPPAGSPWSSDELLATIAKVLDGDLAALQGLLRVAAPVFRDAGYDDVFAAWGAALSVALGETTDGDRR